MTNDCLLLMCSLLGQELYNQHMARNKVYVRRHRVFEVYLKFTLGQTIIIQRSLMEIHVCWDITPFGLVNCDRLVM